MQESFQIAAAKRVPASRGRQALPNSRFKIRAGNKCSLTFWILPSGLDKTDRDETGPNNKK